MSVELSSLDGFVPGDKVLVSDKNTQEEFDAKEVEFTIKSVRIFSDPNEDVKITGYVLDTDDEDDEIMLVIKEHDGFYGITLMYKDNGIGDKSLTSADIDIENDEEEDEGSEDNDGPEEGTGTFEKINYRDIIDLESGDFVDMIIFVGKDGTEMKEMSWIRSGLSHLDLELVEDGEKSEASLCEYFTDEETFGSDLALVICLGDLREGDIELWYGYSVSDADVALFEQEDEDKD